MNDISAPLVWIVHPRSIQDIETEMPLMKKLPSFLKGAVLLCIPPYKVSEFKEKDFVRGYVVALPLLPVHFKRHKFLASFRLMQAFKLAKKLGAEKISVGGMITTLADKMRLSDKFGFRIFDGTDLLAQIVAEKVTDTLKLHESTINIGIIGATTKVGSGLSKRLASRKFKELHLFAKTAANVEKLALECKNIGTVKVICHVDLSQIKECDLCVLTAFISGSGDDIVHNLKQRSTFFSIIEPVSPFVDDIERLRPDIKLSKGISIKIPSLSYSGLDSIVKSGNAFSCLAEALVDGTKGVFQSTEIRNPAESNTFSAVLIK